MCYTFISVPNNMASKPMSNVSNVKMAMRQSWLQDKLVYVISIYHFKVKWLSDKDIIQS